jgi:hypothetical protein
MSVGLYVLVAFWSVCAVAQGEDVMGTASSECPCIDPWGASACSSTYYDGKTCEETDTSCRLAGLPDRYDGVPSSTLGVCGILGLGTSRDICVCLALDLHSRLGGVFGSV